MELLALVWQFLSLWSVIYAIVFLLKYYSTRKENKRRKGTVATSGILPSFASDAESDTTEPILEKDQWFIAPFQVRYTTQRCNRFFRRLNNAAPKFWQLWFSIGAIMGVLIMIGGVLVITYAAYKILLTLSHSPTTGRHMKRSLDAQDEQVFLPMIPGVTLPMSHLGYYLLALLVCGVFHEAGHAIASFSEGVPIHSAGVFVYYIYPGAFVKINEQSLQMLSAFRHLRIICAGVWHNIVLYLWTSVMLAGGLKACLLLLGWQSVQGGVSVVDIRADSPLRYHLPVSSIIYQLDDFELKNSMVDWNAFLLDRDGPPPLKQGFCAAVPKDNQQLACCDIDDDHPFGRSTESNVSCFRDFSFKTSSYKTCLLTSKVLISPETKRCTSDADCAGLQCVVSYTPSANGRIVRMYAKLPSWQAQEESTKSFVFEGELIDIWESIKVGILQPRFWFIPVWIPHVSEMFLRYVSSFTLALALLNILPAFQLDGEHALGPLSTILCHPGRHNAVLTSTARIHPYTRYIVKVTSVVVGFVILASVMMGLLGHP